MAPPFPPPWATLLLDAAPGGTHAFVASLAERGLLASVTQEGWIALPGGFLAQLEAAPYPRDLLAHPGATFDPARDHVACLHVTGGTDDADATLFAASTKHRMASGDAPQKTGRFTRVQALAVLLAKLEHLGEGVVVPGAGQRFLPWSEWPREGGAGEVFAAFVTLARARGTVFSRGMSVFAVADVACTAPLAADPETLGAITAHAFDAAFEMAWQGFAPVGPARLVPFVDANARPAQVDPVAARCAWLEEGTREQVRSWIYRVNLGQVLRAPHLFDDPAASEPDPNPLRRERLRPSIAVYGAPGGPRMASTVGLLHAPRERGPIELVASSPALSPIAALVLADVANVAIERGEGLQPYHRIAMPALEPFGLGGVVLWPSGHVAVGKDRVATWDVLPVTPEELARFRAGEQEAWMDEVESTNAFPRLHARWCAPPAG